MPKSKEFLSSSDDSDLEDEPKPKKKKVEKEKKEAKPEKESKSEKKESKGKEESVKDSSATKGKNGEFMFQLARMRYATVSEFRGKVMVGIREFYEADGELRPGKKGISLNMEQWNKLKEMMDEIDDAIKQH